MGFWPTLPYSGWGFDCGGFRPLGFRPLGFRPLGFRPLGFRPLGFRPLDHWGFDRWRFDRWRFDRWRFDLDYKVDDRECTFMHCGCPQGRYDIEVTAYRQSLEGVYRLCRQCDFRTQQVLEKQTRLLRRTHPGPRDAGGDAGGGRAADVTPPRDARSLHDVRTVSGIKNIGQNVNWPFDALCL